MLMLNFALSVAIIMSLGIIAIAMGQLKEVCLP